MKSFHNSKYLKNKEHLWNLVENLRIQLGPEMQAIFGTPRVGKQAANMIRDRLKVQDLSEADHQAVVGFLLNSFMAKNGTKNRAMNVGKKPSIWEVLQRLEDRISEIEKKLGVTVE
jgi:hypothetical protein